MAAAFGCGDSGDFAPPTAPAVTGSLEYTDPNGDVTELETYLEADSVAREKSRIPLKSSAGIRDGALAFRLTLVTFAAQTILVHARVYDSGGRPSNELIVPIEVMKP
jgi:hypothetical protein